MVVVVVLLVVLVVVAAAAVVLAALAVALGNGGFRWQWRKQLTTHLFFQKLG